MPSQRPLTLIVATTSNLGIGVRNNLPWPSLKSEMAYFARITKRVPPSSPTTARNAVIMGRKTWDSIPPKFRPLKGRLNVVVSGLGNVAGVEGGRVGDEEVVVGPSLAEVLHIVDSKGPEEIARIFVIGGATIYGAALGTERTKRVLVTRVQGEWECDTFFPVELGGHCGEEGGWREKGLGELRKWTGEGLDDGGKAEQGQVRWQYEMYERS